jgi:hypothetical protein
LKKMHAGFVAILAALMVAVVGAPAAGAAPAPGFELFAGCPDLPEVGICLRSDTTAGNLKIGSTNTPINKTLTLSGGAVESGNILANAQGGLMGAPLEVPGGLTGLTGLSEFLINLITFGANRVFAQAEIAGQPNFGADGIKLPIRVKLINPFLKSTCGIGSPASPIVLNLTDETTSPPPPTPPISGTGGTAGSDPNNPAILLIEDAEIVDNAFAVPAASGCDLIGFGLINGLVNARVGLPSAAGKNEARLASTDIRIALKTDVYP